MPKREFVNWGRNQRCLPSEILTPNSVEEVAEIVSRAHRSGGRVKVVGAGHSFTDAACTDGVLLRLDNLASVDSYDGGTGRITVGAGIRLNELNEQLATIGRALPNLGDINVQSLAGATATATHGTGIAVPNLSAGITGIELVTGTGQRLWCDAHTSADIWRMARVGIGALGVITRMELDTVPAFDLLAVEGGERLDDLLSDWHGFVHSADHAEFFWWPGTGGCSVKRNTRTDEPRTPANRARTFVDKMVLENGAFELAQRVVKAFPDSRRSVLKVIGAATPEKRVVDRSDRIFSSPRHVRFVEMEYGVPVADLPEALERIRVFVNGLDTLPMFPIEVRTSAGDDIALSTAHGRDTGWIAIHQYRGVPFGDYFRGVERILDDYDGRPHWGKMHFQTAVTLRPRYPEWDAFQALRAKLDPTGTFANDYLDRVLGPVATPRPRNATIPSQTAQSEAAEL